MENKTEYTPERIKDMRVELETALSNYEVRKSAKGAIANLFDEALTEIERLQAESRTAREEACEIVERVSLECAKEFTGTPKNFTYSALNIAEMFGKVAALTIQELKEFSDLICEPRHLELTKE